MLVAFCRFFKKQNEFILILLFCSSESLIKNEILDDRKVVIFLKKKLFRETRDLL